MKLEKSHEDKVARLLVNFSSHTVNRILNRFDKATQNSIRARMCDLSQQGFVSDDECLKDFAEFLYFKPESGNRSQTIRESDQIVKPAIHRYDIRTSQTPAQQLVFEDILGFSDRALDSVLKAAPPELTISVLCCSPESFIHRVLGRLSDDDADQVRRKINESPDIDISQMHSIHHRYCKFAANHVENGLVRHDSKTHLDLKNRSSRSGTHQ